MSKSDGTDCGAWRKTAEVPIGAAMARGEEMPELRLASMGEAKVKITKLEQTNERLRNLVVEISAERDRLKIKCDQLENEMTMTFGKMHRLRTTIDEMQQIAARRGAEISTLKAVNRRLQQQLERHRGETNDAA